MLNIIKYLFTGVSLLGILLSFSTCKKYPEDNFISLLKPEMRLLGTWQITEYTFRSSSVLDEINDKTKPFDIKDLKISIYKKSGKQASYYFIHPVSITMPDPLVDKNKFGFYRYPNSKFGDSILSVAFLTPFNFVGKKYTLWDIRKLYKNHMTLQLKTDSGNYEIYFEKIEK